MVDLNFLPEFFSVVRKFAPIILFWMTLMVFSGILSLHFAKLSASSSIFIRTKGTQWILAAYFGFDNLWRRLEPCIWASFHGNHQSHHTNQPPTESHYHHELLVRILCSFYKRNIPFCHLSKFSAAHLLAAKGTSQEMWDWKNIEVLEFRAQQWFASERVTIRNRTFKPK